MDDVQKRSQGFYVEPVLTGVFLFDRYRAISYFAGRK